MLSIMPPGATRKCKDRVYDLDEATSVLGKLSSDIQSAVMQTRMMPIEGVFGRFKRLSAGYVPGLGQGNQS